MHVDLCPGSRGSRRSSCNAVLSGGRVDLMGVALGAVFITVLSHDLRFRGYSSGFAQLVQAIVLAGGLALVYVAVPRSESFSRPRA